MDDGLLVFEFRPGRYRTGFIHFDCCREAWESGKYSPPVYVPAADLNGEVCRVCDRPITSDVGVDANGHRG